MEGEDKRYWLNEWGLRYFTSKKDKNQTAMRSYHWCDRITFIDESEGRRYVGETTYTEFQKTMNEWYPMSKKQYDAEIKALQEKHKK